MFFFIIIVSLLCVLYIVLNMSESCDSELTSEFSRLNMISEQINNNDLDHDQVSDSSRNYLAGSYRCEKYDYSTTSDNANSTITPTSVQNVHTNQVLSEISLNNDIQIPIVGYEVMEERARFTVYKLKVENKSTCDCWYVFRRYTDFTRLCSRLKRDYPQLATLVPRKKYFGNNFDPQFLETRILGLQAFVNAIISMPELIANPQIQDFFCLNEPPEYLDTTEESRAIFEALEETIYHLRHQLREKDTVIDDLNTKYNEESSNHENVQTFLKNSTKNCQKCCKDYDNYQKTIRDIENKNRLSSSTSKH